MHWPNGRATVLRTLPACPPAIATSSRKTGSETPLEDVTAENDGEPTRSTTTLEGAKSITGGADGVCVLLAVHVAVMDADDVGVAVRVAAAVDDDVCDADGVNDGDGEGDGVELCVPVGVVFGS